MKHFAKIILLLLFATTLHAQMDFKPEFVIGAGGGVNLAKVSFLPEIEQHTSILYNAGIMARYVAEKHLGIQAELNFSQRGWDENSGGQYQYSQTMNYLEMPVMAHIYFGRKARFFVNLGPKIAFLLNEQENSKNLPASDNAPQHAPCDRKFDYGICAGGGFEHGIGNFRYALEGRYHFGLADIFKNGTKNDFERSSHQYISVNLVLMYEAKSKKQVASDRIIVVKREKERKEKEPKE